MMTHRIANVGAWLSLSALLASSCAASEVPATQLLVEVEAGSKASAQLKYVRAFLYHPEATDESQWATELHFPPTDAASGPAMRFPLSFGIAQGSQERFLLVVKGYESSDPSAPAVIEQKVMTTFQDQQKVVVRMGLLDGCLQRALECSGLSQTCGVGAAGASSCTPVSARVGADATSSNAPDAGTTDPMTPQVGSSMTSQVDAAGRDGGGDDAGTTNVEPSAVSRLQRLCDGGDMGACTDLGIIYEDGTGVPVDLVHGTQLYQKACDGNYARGCANLGLAFYNGLGVAMNRERAADFFQKGCDLGSGRACTNLGTQYESGADIRLDLPRALDLYLRACTLGEAVACSNAGNLYRHGIGVPLDYARALQLEQQACNGGDMAGCNDMGLQYVLALGVTRDLVRAAELFRQACSGGEPQGCANLDRYGLR